MPDLAHTTIADGIATLTMNRPEARNALSAGLIDAVAQALERIEADASLRVVILAGAGKAFCAGMDVKDIIEDPSGMRGMLLGLARIMRRIRLLSVPTIAAVQGAAIGGGCGLMVVTDFAVTHAQARIGYPEVSLGLCPAVVAPWLIRKIGAGRARALLLEGGTISGREAHELGLATHLADHGQVAEAAADLARHLAEGGAKALAITKRWLNELEGTLSDELLDKGAELSARAVAGREAQSRLRARLGK